MGRSPFPGRPTARLGRWVRIVAVAAAQALLLFAVPAQGQGQLQRTQDTVNALLLAAAAMERGDVAGTEAILSGMRSTVASLERTFERQVAVADSAMAQNQEQLKQVVSQITDAYTAELGADAQARELSAKYAQVQARLPLLQKQRLELEEKLAGYWARHKTRIWCNQQAGWGMTDPKCVNWEVAADLTGSGVVGAIEDTTLQLRTVNTEYSLAVAELTDLNARINLRGTEARRLQELRADLNRKEGVLRALIVQVRVAKRFLTDLQPILRYRLEYPLQAFQERVRDLVEDAQETAEVPVFDRHDIRQAETIQQSLTALARTLEEKKTLLRTIESGALVCPPPPKEPTAVSVHRAYAHDWTRYTGTDRWDIIGPARCASPEAIYYGKVASQGDCEFKCKYDTECVMWTYEELPDKGQCWGGTSDLTPNWKPDMKNSHRSGGRNDVPRW
ncbi:hypothetical protein WKW80_22745 [Variovorax humicola]|uniref:Apple domain-containing protein n=1 Tax=Variovorax humicola TaxID=1769758 RepID=A0ABU8W438_9BURK